MPTIVCYPWHEWFAWYPVETEDMGWKWLTNVKRHRIYNGVKGKWRYIKHMESLEKCAYY